MDIRMNAAGDIDITGDTLSLTSGAEAVAQHLRIRLRFFLGEWFLDRRLGVAYYQSILVKGTPLELVRAIYRKVILQTPGIQTIGALTTVLDPITRRLTVEFEGFLEPGVEGETATPFVFEFSEFIISDQIPNETNI